MSTVLLLPPELFKTGHCYKMTRKGKPLHFKVERYNAKMCTYHLIQNRMLVTLTQLEEEDIATIEEVPCEGAENPKGEYGAPISAKP